MHVYFVRHGETLLNRKHIHQSPSTPLSPKGFEQARTVAEALRPYNIDFILTSSYTRTLETARVIGTTLGVTPFVHSAFREVERPTKVCGKSMFRPTTLYYVLASVMNRNNPRWRYHDAENFTDVYLRVQQALAHIESYVGTHQSIAVVSHTVFINLLVTYMCHERELSLLDVAPSFMNIKKMRNGGVIGIEYVGGEAQNVCKWQLVGPDGKM